MRALRYWPDANSYDDLVRVIEQEVEATDDEEERSRLRRWLAATLAVMKDVGAQVLGAVIVTGWGCERRAAPPLLEHSHGSR